MFVTLACVFLFQTAAALVGYDCGSRSLNITTISLLDVGQCEIPPSSLNVSRKYVQLLQVNEFSETQAIQCKLEIHRTVYYCGMYSHISIVRHGEREYIYDISRETCKKLYTTGILELNNHVISGIKINSTTSHPMLYAGYVDNEGKCNGAAYSDPYGDWESVVVQGTIKITLQEQKARVNLNNNLIYLRSGTHCTLSEATCIDVEGGYTFWNSIPTGNCKFHQYSILFEGYANKIDDLVSNRVQSVYSLVTEETTFALMVKSSTNVCGYTILQTEHPKLVIFETVKGESFAENYGLSTDNLDIFTYMNSKFVYVEKHIKTQIRSLYRDVLLQRCNLERETLKNGLAIATQAPDEFAYNLMKGPGYMAVTAGEVVHIIKCIPVEVVVQQGEECYAELKVMLRNTTYYLTPRTHIIKKKGTRVTCNSILPSYYLIEGYWYKLLPRPTEGLKPITIQPSIKPTWEYVNPASLSISGIYTEKELEDLRERIMFPVEKSSLLNDVAREMHGHIASDQDGTLLKLLNEKTMEKIVESTGARLWEKFMTFGTASAGFIAILLIIQGIKIIIDVIINGFLLHRVYGWSIHMMGAIWGTLTKCLILINKRSSKPVPTKRYKMQEDMELGELEVQPQILPRQGHKTTQSGAQSDHQESEVKEKFFSYKT